MSAPGEAAPPTERTRVRRMAERGRYQRDVINAILDEGFVCHLGFGTGDSPTVLPTAYARVGDRLYLHGAAGNHALRSLAGGAPACVAVTLVDGLVLARSVFHHSINYRSVVVFGTAREVTDPHEKEAALVAIVEHIVPGRSADARGPTPSELRATRVLVMDLDEASAKVRSGGPKDEPEDYQLPVWAGHLPLGLVAGAPRPDDGLAGSPPLPGYLSSYRRPRSG